MDTQAAEQVALPTDDQEETVMYQNQNNEGNIIPFTTIRYDPTKDIVMGPAPPHGIWRPPKKSEILLEYLYCLFVGVFSIVINPFSGSLLLETFFSSLFWSFAFICVFYRRNFIVNMLSSIMTKIVWGQTFLAIESVLKAHSGASKSLFLNLLILLSNVVIYMGMSYSRQLTVKSFDGSSIMIITLFGGLLGMGIRFLFHFVTGPWILIYGSLTFLVVASILPLMMIRRDKDQLVRRVLVSCIILYIISISSILIYYWTDGQKFAKQYIFSAKNNDPAILMTIVDQVHLDVKYGKFDSLIKRDPFDGKHPFLTKLLQWVIRWALVEGIFGFINVALTRKKLYYPLYYQVAGEYGEEEKNKEIFDKFTNDVRSTSVHQLLTSDAFAERDAVFALWIMGAILTGFVGCIMIVWMYFDSLRKVHRETVKSMLMPVEERLKIDPNTYTRRIIVDDELLQDLKMRNMMAPKTMTEEHKMLFTLVSSGGVMAQN